MKLAMPDPLAAATYVHERVEHWSSHLSDWCSTAVGVEATAPNLSMPSVVRGRWAGRYSSGSHRVVLPVPWAMIAGDAYDETIAHEVCHAYQRAVYAHGKWHGEIFHFLLHIVCRKPHTRYHRLPVTQAKALSKVLFPALKGVDLADLIQRVPRDSSHR